MPLGSVDLRYRKQTFLFVCFVYLQGPSTCHSSSQSRKEDSRTDGVIKKRKRQSPAILCATAAAERNQINHLFIFVRVTGETSIRCDIEFMASRRTVRGKVANSLSTPLLSDALSGGEGETRHRCEFLLPECRIQATASDLCSEGGSRPINSPRQTDEQSAGEKKKKSHKPL